MILRLNEMVDLNNYYDYEYVKTLDWIEDGEK